jgi:parallel beta-helix repeat protein
MRRRSVLTACLCALLLLVTIFAFCSKIHVGHAAVINVPQDCSTIQEAITGSSDGDTIKINRRSGESQSVYYERLVIDKQLTLVGESRQTVIIDGGGLGTVVRIQAHNVEIRNVTIRNAGQKYSGIRANGYSYLTIANNTLETNKKGIVLLNSYYNTIVHNLLFDNSAEGISLSESVGNNVSENSVSDSTYGIKLSSTNATFVVGNAASDTAYGIYLEYSSNDTVDSNIMLRNRVDGIFPHACHDVIVSNNEISESAYGVQLYNSDTITVLGNNATDNSYGVYLAYSGPSNTIENNTISTNDWGVALYSSSGNTLKGNELSSNTYGVDPVTESDNNLVYHNNFINNTEQVVWNPDCHNTWDNGYPSGGNYWSDYTGVDEKSGPGQDQPGSDGLGDTNYGIDPMNKDRYPLIIPWGIIHDVAVINVTSSATTVYAGDTVCITVVTENQGTEIETFNITAKYENTTYGIVETVGAAQVTDLAPDANVTLTFTWNTTNVQACTIYTITAEADTTFGERDTSDNTYTDGTIKVKIPGDVDEDGDVDIEDLSMIARAWGTTPAWPHGTDWHQWNPECDINHDEKVDAHDLAVASGNFGITC